MKASGNKKSAFWEVEVNYGTWEEAEEILTKVVKKIYETPQNQECSMDNAPLEAF